VSNLVVLENEILEGRAPQSYWDVPHTRAIEGFTTDISVNVGGRVDFKINVNGDAGSDYKVEIFRLGYYGGDGARKVAEWVNTDATVQPDAMYDATRGLVDAGNWSVTDSWAVPESTVSGVFLARLQRLDDNGQPIAGAVNQIPFIIRDDDRPSDVVFQTSDTTWHAYNGWFGNNGQVGANFYGDTSGTIDHPDVPDPGLGAQDRAYAVSYNRPFITRGIDGEQGGPAAGAQDYLFGAEYAAIQWLEKNGYDVSYISGIDTDRLGPGALLDHKAFLSVGHDEYWSGEQRMNVEAARDAGVNLLFWSGNEVYWKTRYEGSIVDGEAYRTLVCYKETWANGNPNAGPDDYYDLDPTDIWTGTWRDTRFLGNPLAGAVHPDDFLSGQCPRCACAENSLTGQLFAADDAAGQFGALDVPAGFAPLRVWRDTSIANGGALNIAPGIIGYEWNISPLDENRPGGLIYLSETKLAWNRLLVDNGNLTAPGEATHNLTLYRADSGALVFAAGTVFWSWMLSNAHDNQPYSAAFNIANRDLQQFTINMFADMGIQPGVSDAVLALQGLIRATASTDTIAATAEFLSLPTDPTAFSIVRLSGIATDDDGNPATDDGAVAMVEISFDGGNTWRPAEGRTNWTYDWVVTRPGTYEIVVRAIDDSLNIPDPRTLQRFEITVGDPVTPPTVSLFDPFQPVRGVIDRTTVPLEIGTRFIAAASGQITELKYWRAFSDASDTDVRVGHLWAADGTLLAEVTFTSNPGETGWQVATLDTPVDIRAGAQYTVSYVTLDNYTASVGFFADDYVDPFGVLAAPALVGGVYAYGGGGMPTQSYRGANYWVDVTFAPGPITNAPPVITSDASFSIPENRKAVAAITAVDPEGDALTFAIAGGADSSAFVIDPRTGALSFILPPDYENPADANRDNVYELIVSVADRLNQPVVKPITVTVQDVVSEGATQSALFGLGDVPATTITTDPTDYELGVRFVAAQSGEITALRYFRGEADAGDTDIRTLNLWTATGTLLATATVISRPGEAGWQEAVLATPIAVEAGVTYVASYGTTQNYAFTAGYFSGGHSGPGGVISAPTAAGVFAAGATGIFPTATFGGSNYWVDVVFEAPAAEPNQPPSFTGANAFEVVENEGRAATLRATDPDGDTLTYAILGGADAGRFTINASTGALSFVAPPDYERPADLDRDNLYELVVSAADGRGGTAQQAITVRVLDDPDEPVETATSLFGRIQPPATAITDDPTDYELGVQFRATASGSITSLMYWRAPQDSGDTDARTLNLWSADGRVLGSVTVVSAPGDSGWQVGELATPVSLTAGALYVASYGTTQNYVASGGYFNGPYNGGDGILLAPTSGGVFSAGGTGRFPTQSYNASNYWVDVVFQPAAPNGAPSFTSESGFDVVENTRYVGRLAAADPDGDALTFAIAGGADASRFTLDPASGRLWFLSPPDHEAPRDANGDNVYRLNVSVSDGATTVSEAITVRVTDDPTEAVASASTLFGLPGVAGQTFTNDPADYELGVRFRATDDGRITALTYYRGAEDAGDTDVRTLNLWSADGQLLASAAVTSRPGEAGWQVAQLATPVDIDRDTLYVASYGTTQNYVASGAYFTDPQVGPDGVLLAAAGSSGVFSTAGPGFFPTQSYNASNYWVDVLFEPNGGLFV
jgi:hypothetical protein